MQTLSIEQLIGNAEMFPILREWEFFNHAGVAPLPKIGGDVLRAYAEQAERAAYVDSGWYRELERLRESAGRLINATAREIALVKNTSEGIATVAAGLDWKAGDRVVTTGVEYPANIYPWMDLANRLGVELVMVAEETHPSGARSVPMESLVKEARHPRTRLVALSHVEFASGQRHDLAALGAACRAQGKLFCVDAIQSVGVLPVDVRAMNIDFLSADGHKWLLGPEGAGIFYCREELLTRLRPLIIGWMNVIDADNYGHYDFTLKTDARRFECGTHNVPGLLALKASIDLLLSVGVEAIGARLERLTGRLIDGLQRKGYQIVSPRGHGEWSGIVSFVSSVFDHAEIYRTLRDKHRTEIALREKRLRCSAHFYNTEAQIDHLVEHLPTH